MHMQEIPPEAQLFQMMSGFVVSQAIYCAARLGVADLLADGPRSTEHLAAQTGTSPDSVYRLLRALATAGIFAETEPRTFGLTPVAELLRSDHPARQRSMALMLGGHQYATFGELLYSIQTGQPAFDKVYGRPIFEYLGEHPEEGRIFDEAMMAIHGGETRPMIEAYDFSAFKTVIDVGGGNGSMLMEILRASPATRGIVFDLPQVVERTLGSIREAGLAERCGVAPGSIFESAPGAGPEDAYILRHLIHDCDDQRSVQILCRCREAGAPGTRVLVIESVLPPGNEPHPGKWLDLVMMVSPGGRERTASEFQRLFETAGLKLSRIVPTCSPVSVVEGVIKR
jgi:hypothetical protein